MKSTHTHAIAQIGEGTTNQARSIRLSLKPLDPFDFELTVRSNGWMELAPNLWDAEHHTLKRIQQLSTGKVVLLNVAGLGSFQQPTIAIDTYYPGKLSLKEQNEIITTTGYMLRVDENLSEFYSMCRKRGKPWLQVTAGLGRVLRSPTLFEDVVKTICTTNVQWGGTKGMIKRLVDNYGEPYDGNEALRAFPAPEVIVATPADKFAAVVRMGYRSDYVYTFAQQVVDGEMDLSELLDVNLPTPAVKKKLLTIKGVGNYAAATLLMLIGRYDELPIDTAFREFVSRTYFKGRHPTDQQAQAVYADWGKWKYLAYWFDIWSYYSKQSTTT